MSKAPLQTSTDDREMLLTNYKKLVRWFLLGYIVLSIGSLKAHAVDMPLDYQVKAAITYKFLGYSEWPLTQFSDLHSPYRIWVLGSTDVKNELQRIVAHRIINGRSIEIHSARTIDQIDGAHIVFVASDMEPLLPKLTLAKNAYLIITENEQGLVAGSVINLRLVDGRIGFDISLKYARLYGIILSSRLLSVAVSIEEEDQQ